VKTDKGPDRQEGLRSFSFSFNFSFSFDPSLASAVSGILCHVQLLPTAPTGSAVFRSFCQVQLLPASSDCLLVQLFSGSLCQVQVLPAASDSRQIHLFPTACVRFSSFRQLLT
jgi:hypothetical protein